MKQAVLTVAFLLLWQIGGAFAFVGAALAVQWLLTVHP